MSWYVQDVLIRDQLAEAQRRAAHNRLVREARERCGRSSFWSRLVGWLSGRAVTRDPAIPLDADGVLVLERRGGALPGAMLVPRTRER